MTDITRLLENPVEATTIVQNFVLLLVEHVVCKKKKKKNEKKRKLKRKKKEKKKKEKKERLMRPLHTEPVTSLDKCRVTFHWVIKCVLSRSTTQPRHYMKIKGADNQG